MLIQELASLSRRDGKVHLTHINNWKTIINILFVRGLLLKTCYNNKYAVTVVIVTCGVSTD
jgi:hypothetical protein